MQEDGFKRSFSASALPHSHQMNNIRKNYEERLTQTNQKVMNQLFTNLKIHF
jgi:hypothetical protein